MLTFIKYFNFMILVLFFCCYFYQMIYVFLGFKHKYMNKNAGIKPKKFHRFAVLICARNESAVIGQLLDSLASQTYPQDRYDVYVVADNCTDNTAQIARDKGAYVYERFDLDKVGKGYALNFAFDNIKEDKGIRFYDGYMIFDADNVLDTHYIEEMNKTFDQGYQVVTSYRNSKNYDSNWISAGYALWFLRESCYLNGARMECHSSCAISGTGFVVDSEIIERNNGWKHHLLTEDIEFSVDNASKGIVIGYCSSAILYDEQPVSFAASWKQRLRWSKGFYQVLWHYGKRLVKGIFGFKGYGFQCYDMLMTLAPATLLTLLTIVVNGFAILVGVAEQNPFLIELSLLQVIGNVVSVYCSLLFFGAITTITEWNQIYSTPKKKIFYIFTFPIFILTYIPIAIVALVRPVKWEPIRHTICKNVQEIRQ